jgi:hypothetical protein
MSSGLPFFKEVVKPVLIGTSLIVTGVTAAVTLAMYCSAKKVATEYPIHCEQPSRHHVAGVSGPQNKLSEYCP